MARIVTRKLMVRLVVIMVAVGLGPLAAVGVMSYLRADTALEEVHGQMCDAVRAVQTETLVDYLVDAVDAGNHLAAYDGVAMALEKFDGAHLPGKGGEGSDLEIAHARLMNLLGKHIEQHSRDGYKDTLLIQPKGDVVFSVTKLADQGTNLRTGELRDSGLAMVWEKVVKTQQPAMVDLTFYRPANEPSLFMGVPVVSGKDNTFRGVLAIRLGLERINALMHLPDSMGKTADGHLVGRDGIMRSQSKLAESTALKKKVETEAVTAAFQGKTGRGIMKDERGILTISAYGPVRLREVKGLGADFDWALVVEMDEAEASEDSIMLGWQILAMGLIMAAAVAVAGVFLARSLARPIKMVSDAARTIAQGDLTVQVPHLKREDEIGVMNSAFGEMASRLREQTRRTLDGINVLTASAAEISATVSQLAVTTSRTSSAVGETTTTVEEVRQLAQLSSDRARRVAEGAQMAVQVSEEGKTATEETMTKMTLIKEQMESIGETVVRLSEQSRAIEQIVAAVQDLADQSNLLAVNASIEAARAGDQGKGFAVVAHEIKSLADQSREATQQIRSILDETRKWVSAVVMATEQGSRAVRDGVDQSGRAGRSIEKLAASLAESSEAASVIETSSGQQSVGVDQVSTAMANISQSMQQTVSGTAQLEVAAEKLKQLGDELKQLVEAYKV